MKEGPAARSGRAFVVGNNEGAKRLVIYYKRRLRITPHFLDGCPFILPVLWRVFHSQLRHAFGQTGIAFEFHLEFHFGFPVGESEHVVDASPAVGHVDSYSPFRCFIETPFFVTQWTNQISVRCEPVAHFPTEFV